VPDGNAQQLLRAGADKLLNLPSKIALLVQQGYDHLANAGAMPSRLTLYPARLRAHAPMA